MPRGAPRNFKIPKAINSKAMLPKISKSSAVQGGGFAFSIWFETLNPWLVGQRLGLDFRNLPSVPDSIFFIPI